MYNMAFKRGRLIKNFFFLIVPFLFLWNFKFISHAEMFLPSVETLETAQQFQNLASASWFSQFTGRELPSDVTVSEAFRTSGYDLSAYDQLQWQYQPYNSLGWKISKHLKLYDDQGNEQTNLDDVFFAGGKNSYSGQTFFYDKNGNILRIGEEFSSSESTLNAHAGADFHGALGYNQDDFFDFANHAFNDTNEYSIYIANPDDLTSSKIEYLNTLPNASYGVANNGAYGYYMVDNVPGSCININNYGDSQYAPTILVGENYQSYLNIWTSDPSYTFSKYNVVVPQTRTYDGHTYVGVFPSQGANPYSKGLAENKNGFYNYGSGQNTNLDDVIICMPVTINNSLPETINYDKFQHKPDKTITYNQDFSTNNNVSTNNFPLNTTISYPSYSPTYNYFYEYNTSVNNPSIGEDITTVPNDLGFNLPILNNLSRRFPFSIPWDIYNMIKVLDVERTPPVIYIDYTFPVVNYRWQFQIDFEMFSQTAEIFRVCFLISFVIGLAVFSYNHFFGS